MGGYYTVVQGDHLSKIAKEHGFPDYHVIWDDPNNAELKQMRQNPNVLFPGDQVFVPDKEDKEESGNTEKRHTFQVDKEPLKLRLVLEDAFEKPIANAKCALTVDGQVSQPTTDGNGKIEVDIPSNAQSATLVIRSDETSFQNIPIPIPIGNLDPGDQLSGQISRLNNLGYFAGNLDGTLAGSGVNAAGGNGTNTAGCGGCGSADGDSNNAGQDGEQQFRSAVEEFQCDQGLTVDGICGPQTQAKLKQVHGC